MVSAGCSWRPGARAVAVGLLLTGGSAACGGAQVAQPGQLAPPEPAIELYASGAPEGTPVRVRFALLRLAPGQRQALWTSTCQDVLVLVRQGEVRARGEGLVAEDDADASTLLRAWDAARLGPGAPAALENSGEGQARALLVFARSGARPIRDLADVQDPPDDCDPESTPATMRVASAAAVEPLVVAGGKLRVQILLDAGAAGARHGGLALLDGDADIAVPEHAHADEDEALFIDGADLTMVTDGAERHVGAGEVVYLPAGARHSLRSAGTTPLRAIQVYAPSGPEQRFRTMAQGAQQGTAPASQTD